MKYVRIMFVWILDFGFYGFIGVEVYVLSF